jgi:hypothetical protein
MCFSVRYPPLSEHALFSEVPKASPARPSNSNIIRTTMRVEQWWNYSERGKSKYWEKTVSQYHFAQPYVTLTDPWLNTVHSGGRPAGYWPTEPWHSDLSEGRWNPCQPGATRFRNTSS